MQLCCSTQPDIHYIITLQDGSFMYHNMFFCLYNLTMHGMLQNYTYINGVDACLIPDSIICDVPLSQHVMVCCTTNQLTIFNMFPFKSTSLTVLSLLQNFLSGQAERDNWEFLYCCCKNHLLTKITTFFLFSLHVQPLQFLFRTFFISLKCNN